jgi:RND family efflux transporter MFP subunit
MFLAAAALGCDRGTPPPEEVFPPAPVKWMEARQLFVEEWTEIIGTTQPLLERSARVSAGVEGQVLSVLPGGTDKPLAEGQRVSKGAVLVRLDDQIASANRAKLVADLEDLRQQVEQAGFAVDLAQIELRRLEELRQQNGLGDQRLAPQVAVDKARVALAEAKSKRAGSELRLKAGEKQLQALEEQLKLYTLTAPISGRLGRILAVPGQTLAVGAPVAEILDLDNEIDLLCFVPPYLAKKLKLGQTVRLGPAGAPALASAAAANSDAPKGTANNAEGRLVYIADQAEVDTGNFAVKARFSNKHLGLHGNVTRRARVLTAPGKAAWTLPESALMEDQDPPAVIVVEDYKQDTDKDGKEIETGKARKLRVQVGTRDRVLHLVEILGLDDAEKKWQGSLENAKFVIESGQGLRNGDAIRLEQEDEDEAAAEDKKDG